MMGKYITAAKSILFLSQSNMANKKSYGRMDIEYLERLYAIELLSFSTENPTCREIDFLEDTVKQLRKKIEQLKTTIYQSNEDQFVAIDFYKKNLAKQLTYLDLVLEKKILLERKSAKLKVQ